LNSSLNQMLATLSNRTPEELTKMRERAARQLGVCNQSAGLAAGQLIKAIDELVQQRNEELIGELKGMTVAERVVRAFTVERLTETEAKVVQALLDQPGSTSTELSRHLNWGGQIWHEKFGTMCKKRELYLWPAKDAVTRDGKFYTGILADLDPDGNRFTMKPDVAAAFARLGLKAKR
jgi:hypothetical protein